MMMLTLMNLHIRFLVGLSTLFFFIILVGFAQYWLGHILEDEIEIDFTNDTLASSSASQDERQFQEVIEISEILPNCGIQSECPEDTFPVHIYTGQDKDDRPKLCVLGKYIIGGNMNGGRGLNAAIIETSHLNVVSVQNFDLYSQNSSALEVWLIERVHDNDIIIAFTFDEASKELSKKAKTTFYKLGSGKIQDLQFRSQWYMISQKGIKGFTALEKLTYAKNDHWGEAIDEKMCVPKHIPSVTITPDPFPRKNAAREKLCRDVPQLECTDFCGSLSQHEVFTPALLTNRSLIGNPVYSSPIVVVAGELSSLVLTLQNLIHQPGIHAPSVLVVYNQSLGYNYSTLINIFSFQALPINATDSKDYIDKGVQIAKERFPNKKYVLIIEDGVLLSPDFLHYMAQMVHILEKDHSTVAISAWNPNGFENVSSNRYLAYRSEDRPQYAYMVPFDVIDSKKFSNICKTQAKWKRNDNSTDTGEIIFPEVSRILKRPLDILLKGEQDHHLLTIPRTTNIDPGVWIDNPENMIFDNYMQLIEAMINQSKEIYLRDEDVLNCPMELNNDNPLNVVAHDSSDVSTIVIYYKETKSMNHRHLRALASCFGISFPENTSPPGIYKGMLRFTFNRKHVMLIESSSHFHKSKLTIEKKIM